MRAWVHSLISLLEPAYLRSLPVERDISGAWVFGYLPLFGSSKPCLSQQHLRWDGVCGEIHRPAVKTPCSVAPPPVANIYQSWMRFGTWHLLRLPTWSLIPIEAQHFRKSLPFISNHTSGLFGSQMISDNVNAPPPIGILATHTPYCAFSGPRFAWLGLGVPVGLSLDFISNTPP